MKILMRSTLILLAAALTFGCSQAPEPMSYDVIIRGGNVYDGLGGNPVQADVGINGDRIATVGDLTAATGTREIDATGMAVSPGFINMLSWATESLIVDGRGMSDIKQGVTLEVMGEGWSMGPVNDELRELAVAQQRDFKYEIEWTTLGEYLEYLENRMWRPMLVPRHCECSRSVSTIQRPLTSSWHECRNMCALRCAKGLLVLDRH